MHVGSVTMSLESGPSALKITSKYSGQNREEMNTILPLQQTPITQQNR